MAAATTLPVLLDSLTQSISSTLEATSKIPSVDAPKDGISLLDVKNELLLSYLQNLVFLILVKLRKAKQGDTSDSDDDDDQSALDGEVVRKLVELRLYLEKGVRPMEDKLRYQIEKVLRAADDSERNAKAAAAAADNKSEPESGSDSDEASGDEADERPDAAKLADLAFRPGALIRPTTSDAGGKPSKDSDGIYRPPKIAATSMPTTETRERRQRGPIKSATMDEFIADEMSSAPQAQPSIGTNIVQFGRRLKTEGERKDEDERRNYEERNFVRLAKASKKDRAQQASVDARRGRMNYGGEEFRDLGMGVDRINRMTQKKEGGGTRALLEKSRKRGPETTDGPRGTGNAAMGERYEKRLKTLEGGRRDRGKGR
ncbi:unnamed protein product [Discula destructiva]